MLDNQYFRKYLDDRGVDLKEHLKIEKLCTLDINPKEFENFAEIHRKEATVKWYHPRPFLNAQTNEQAINANWIGYNKHNTTESNWGLDGIHNNTLKGMVGGSKISAIYGPLNRKLYRKSE